MARRLVLERDGDSTERYRGRPFGGRLRLLGPWALLRFGSKLRGACFVVCECVYLISLFFEEGVFPHY
jgi:hypothetical protein